MKDFQWFKILTHGYISEEISIQDYEIKIVTFRHDDKETYNIPYVYALAGFKKKEQFPFITIILEETILSDYCISVRRDEEYHILSHIPYSLPLEDFRNKAFTIFNIAISEPHIKQFLFNHHKSNIKKL